MTANEYLIERNLWYTEDNKIEITNEALAILMSQYAHHKCLEAIRNTRHKAVDILMEEYQQASVSYIANQIQNIKNEDVLPKF